MTALTLLISLTITAAGLLASWAAYKRRGLASGLRGAAWSLVPMAGYLTGLTGFVVGLALDPLRWLGVILAGLAAVLYVSSGVMLRRRAGDGAKAAEKTVESGKGGRARRAAVQAPGDPVSGDPDLADVEAILRRRGIG